MPAQQMPPQQMSAHEQTLPAPPYPPTQAAQQREPTQAAQPYPPTQAAQQREPTQPPQPYPPTQAAQQREPTQPPQPYPPTQAAQQREPTQPPQPYPPTQAARPYAPTEVTPPYPPAPAAQAAQAAQPYQPAQAAPAGQPYPPSQGGQPYPPTQAAQPYSRTELDPQGRASRSNPTVMGPIAPQAPGGAGWQETVAPANQPAAPYRPEPPTGFAPVAGAAGGFGAAGLTAAAPATEASPRQPNSDILRYGPGVPPSQAGVSAEQVWRTGQMPDPPRRPVRRRRLAGSIGTVILLIAAGVLLFLRFYHAPFHVTGKPELSFVPNGCAVNVTGKIPTNGSSGTVSYQWVFTPQQQAPQPLSQSVVSGQHAVYVTVAVQGQGHGTASEQVTLQVLAPNQETASTVVKVSC
jgi:hypothetical protein